MVRGIMDNKDIIKLARERANEALAADGENRERAADDLQFVVGNQWPEKVRLEREAAGKPCLTINGLVASVRQVTGQIRNLNPTIAVVAADGDADEDVAEVIGGLVRHIQSESDAASVYEQAAESAAACSIGHWRLRSQFLEGDTFDQEIIIERIHNPFSVLWDTFSKDVTRKDATWCQIMDAMSLDDFKETYPDATAEDVPDDKPNQNSAYSQTWFTTDHVTIAEYFWIEKETHTIGITANGEVIKDPTAAHNVVKKREVEDRKVMWAKISGAEVLEGPTEIPARWIPVFTVTGEEWHLGEEMYRSSVIRFAKDPQQLYNYSRSAHAEMVALQPKAPYMVTPREIAGNEANWATANQENRPYQVFTPDPAMGGSRPARTQPPVASSGLLNEITIAAEDIKRTTGIFDASLGASSNEKSGIALQRRQAETQNGTSVYSDNMVKSIRHTGRVMVDMIPRVYDTQRTIRILNETDQEKMVVINTVVNSQGGEIGVNDLTVGRYDVKIQVGPSHETKREAAADGMMRFIGSVPQAAAVTSDLIAKAQDWPDADRFAERLRKTLPPGMISEDDMTDEEKQAAQQAAQIQQQTEQQAQQLAQAKIEAEVQGEQASAANDAAKAKKTDIEAAGLQLELAIKSGLLNDAIRQAVAQALQPQGQIPTGVIQP